MPERNIDTRYQQMTPDELYLEVASLERMFKTFLIIAGYPNDLKYNVDVMGVVETITRIDKRTAYYFYFHEGNKIHEMKRVGILVYWLLKFKPFRIIDPRIMNGTIKQIEDAFNLNESFALSLIYSGLLKSNRLNTTPKSDGELHKNLLYTLKYREMSQDSIMSLVYSFYNILE